VSDFNTLSSQVALAHRPADIARQATLTYFRDPSQQVSAKQGEMLGSAHFDPVTEADRGAEAKIRHVIETECPEFGLIGEELGALRPQADLRWIVDPIDGTRSYICGLPTWTTLVGLASENESILGVVDQPFTGERWLGSKNGAYWMRRYEPSNANDLQKIQCRPCASIEEACIATTDPRPGALFSVEQARGFDDLARRARVIRFSTDAYGYVLVASGNLDLVIESGLHLYDIAAIIPLIEAAGGLITDWQGCTIKMNGDWNGTVVAAGDVRIHREALDAIATW